MQHPDRIRRPRTSPRVRGDVIPPEAVRARVLPRERPEPPTRYVELVDTHPGPVEWPPLTERAALGLSAAVWVLLLIVGAAAGQPWLALSIFISVIATLAIWSQTR